VIRRASGTVLPTSLDQALHRCITLASRFGTIRLTRPDDPDRRQFFLDLDEGSARLMWTLRKVSAGTELSVRRPPTIAGFANLARRGSTAGRQLDRRLQLLPHIASLKIAVVGGGTGLYTALVGLRDRTWSLTAVISGLPKTTRARDPKDHLGSLPRDDADLGLVALTPSLEENLTLRRLLSHRMENSSMRGAHFGVALLAALEEIQGSRQGALDTAVELLGIRGRIVLALEGASAVAALSDADMIVIAPGLLEIDLLPVLCCPGVIAAIRGSTALKVMVTTIMTAEDSHIVPTTSRQVAPLATLTGLTFDVVLSNSGSFTPGQLRAYAARGAHPIQPDLEATLSYTKRLMTEDVAARGDLARHDPEQLGESLVELGAQSLLEAVEEQARGA
jgi:2-phospho-L-lactate transferase/gluconeogenesis factor (CofD/UPF0052 family)